MVKSKKMSKSTVAIVLLSLLLVLSLILTATGAWFTYKADNAGGSATGGYTFRDNAMSVAFGDLSSDFGKVYRGAEEVTDHTDIMPGDVIKGGSLVATFTLPTGKTAYAIYKEGAGEWKNASDKSDASTTNLTTVANAETLTFEVSDLVLTGANYDNSKQGTGIDVSQFTIGALTIRMIQSENLTAEAAYQLLIADSFQENPIA